MGSSTADDRYPYRPELELIPIEPEIRRKPTIEDWIFGNMRPLQQLDPNAPKKDPLKHSLGDRIKAAQAKKKPCLTTPTG